jgi:signal transduction histidine kinase
MLDEDIEAVSPAEMEWLREQLVRAQRLSSVGTLASSVAHEFNNILTTILNYAKMAQKPTTTDASKNQALDRIVQASQRAAAIVSGMLGMARPGTLKRQMTNLGTLVDEVLLLAGKDLSQHRIRVEKKIATVSAPVVSAQVEQVLLNLVINARQAMREGGPAVGSARKQKLGCGGNCCRRQWLRNYRRSIKPDIRAVFHHQSARC